MQFGLNAEALKLTKFLRGSVFCLELVSCGLRGKLLGIRCWSLGFGQKCLLQIQLFLLRLALDEVYDLSLVRWVDLIVDLDDPLQDLLESRDGSRINDIDFL